MISPRGCTVVFVALVALACTKDDPQPTVYPANAATGLPACTVPASMTPVDEANTWSIGRAFMECEGQSIEGECLTDGTTTCPQFAAGTVTCTNLCKADEYGVTYGSAGSEQNALTPPLIASCTGTGLVSFAGSGGSACCPCQ